MNLSGLSWSLLFLNKLMVRQVLLRLLILFFTSGSFIGIDKWYPVVGEPDDDLPGYMLEIANKAFKDVEYRPMPWSRALVEVRNHRVDCILGAAQSDLQGLAVPEESWGLAKFAVYVRAGDPWIYTGPSSLLG